MKQCFITGMTHFISEIFLNIVAYWQAGRLSCKVMDLVHHSWKVKQRQLSKRPAWTLRGAAALVSEVNRVLGFEKHEGGKKKEEEKQHWRLPCEETVPLSLTGSHQLRPSGSTDSSNRRFFFLLSSEGHKIWGAGVGWGSIWHVRSSDWFLVFLPLNSIKLDKMKTKGKTQCRQSINMQDGTTQLLYISCYKSDSRHIKAVFRQSGFFPLLSFSFFFLSPPPPLAMQERATIMQPWQHPMHTWCQPIYTHGSTRRIEKQMKSYQMFVCLMWWVSRRRPSSVFQAAGWRRRDYVDPRTIELHDGSCMSPRFCHFCNFGFQGFGDYLYLPHSFFFLLLLLRLWLCCFTDIRRQHGTLTRSLS